MPFDPASKLWPNVSEQFFRQQRFLPVRQSGPHCVSTVLAILSGAAPATFQRDINTQDPASWSDALRSFGMKLAYCPTDIRKLKFYIAELLTLDDLFTLSYYTPKNPAVLLADPDEAGWVCGSHVVVLHRDSVLDPATGTCSKLGQFIGCDRHTKRIFRVVPLEHARGL